LATFSISDIEKFTGIKAHTLRIWEQRYNLLIPKRTETKIRYYDDEDLKLLLNVSILLNNGYKISKVAALEKSLIDKAVYEISSSDTLQSDSIKGLCAAMLSVDEHAFNKIISTYMNDIGLEKTMSELIFPFLCHIGVLWMTGAIHPAHEHFITNLIKQKLYVAIDGQTYKLRHEAPKFLLYLPEGETHEIGLLFANYILQNRGFKVVYLGQMTPEEDIINVFEFYKPQYIFTSVTASIEHFDSMKDFIQHTADIWKDAKVLITGNQILNYSLETPKNIHLMKDLNSFLSFIEKDLQQASQHSL
jgi:DNA-binding transcriptional MerR regulator